MIQKLLNFPYLGQSLLSLILAGIFFYLDLLLPLGFAAGIPYISLVLIGLWSASRRLIIFNSLLGTFLTLLGAYLSPDTTDITLAIFNRILSIATLWLTTYFCFMNIHWMEDKLRSDLLEKTNKRLQEETGYVQLHRDIATFTNLSHSLDDSITYSLRKICEFTHWPVGHLYLLAEDGKTLYSSGMWYLENNGKFKTFQNITKESRMIRGEGLPGRVIANGKAQFIFDLQTDSNFPRAALSDEIGVVSGFGFPILIEDRPVGVMEFFSSQPREPGKRMMEVMESIGVLLGRIIERTQADRDKEKYSDRLRQLYRNLDSIREEESKRIAREVHDNLGQVLTSLKLELSLLDSKLSESNIDVKDNISMMFNLIDKNIEVVKKISHDLRPPVLDALSLTEAIDWQGTSFQEKTGINFLFSAPQSKTNLDPGRSTTIFRIFQECLTNVLRHSKASEVQVDISEQNNYFVMRVKDNGIGLTGDEVNSNLSLGVLGMKERARMWGGTVECAGAPNQGTTVTIQLKYE